MKLIVDTREQFPLWESGDHAEHGIEFVVERRTLRTGDYAIAGLEHHKDPECARRQVVA